MCRGAQSMLSGFWKRPVFEDDSPIEKFVDHQLAGFGDDLVEGRVRKPLLVILTGPEFPANVAQGLEHSSGAFLDTLELRLASYACECGAEGR
jgi:hypothetical protein